MNIDYIDWDSLSTPSLATCTASSHLQNTSTPEIFAFHQADSENGHILFPPLVSSVMPKPSTTEPVKQENADSEIFSIQPSPYFTDGNKSVIKANTARNYNSSLPSPFEEEFINDTHLLNLNITANNSSSYTPALIVPSLSTCTYGDTSSQVEHPLYYQLPQQYEPIKQEHYDNAVSKQNYCQTISSPEGVAIAGHNQFPSSRISLLYQQSQNLAQIIIQQQKLVSLLYNNVATTPVVQQELDNSNNVSSAVTFTQSAPCSEQWPAQVCLSNPTFVSGQIEITHAHNNSQEYPDLLVPAFSPQFMVSHNSPPLSGSFPGENGCNCKVFTHAPNNSHRGSGPPDCDTNPEEYPIHASPMLKRQQYKKRTRASYNSLKGISSAEKKKSNANFICLGCNRLFVRKKDLERHHNTVKACPLYRTENQKKIVCKGCFKSYSRGDALSRHQDKAIKQGKCCRSSDNS